MDIVTHQLAVQMLESATGEMAEQFDAANALMVAHLGSTALDREHLVRETEARELNTELLRGIMSHFPHAEPRSPYSTSVEFVADTPEAYTKVRSSVVWAHGLGDEEGTPYYIIGERVRPVPEGTRKRRNYPRVDLLLWQANGDAQRRASTDPLNMAGRFTDMSLMSVGTSYLHEYLAFEQQRLKYGLQPNPRDYKEAYSHQQRAAVMANGQGFRAVSFGSEPVVFKGDMQNHEDLDKLWIKMKAFYMPRSYGTEFKNGVSNELLADFDVFRHIIKLALHFGMLQPVAKNILETQPSSDAL